MKTRLALPLAFALLLAACGGATGPGSTAKGTTATQKPAAGSVDCAKLKTAAAQLIGIQLLTQLTTPESIATIKSLGNLDLDKMLSALGDLHALDSVSSPLGNAK